MILDESHTRLQLGQGRPRQGTEICNFGAPSPRDLSELSPVDFVSVSPGLLCNLVRKSAQDVEKIDFRAEKNPVASLAVMAFSVPIQGYNYISMARLQNEVVPKSFSFQNERFREVLHGVAEAGVGVKFLMFAVNCSRFPCSLGEYQRSEEKRETAKKNQEKQHNNEKAKKSGEKKGKIPPTPSTPTPLRTSQRLYRQFDEDPTNRPQKMLSPVQLSDSRSSSHRHILEVGKFFGHFLVTICHLLVCVPIPFSLPIVAISYEQWQFYANKAKTEMRHFCLKHDKTRYTPVKQDRFLKSPRNGQHPERDQNEIGTRYEFAYFEAIEGQDRVALKDAPGFSLLEYQMS